MEPNKTWQDEIDDILANIHPVQITDGIIIPAISQLIDDYEDSLSLYDKTETEQIKFTKELIEFWKGIKATIIASLEDD